MSDYSQLPAPNRAVCRWAERIGLNPRNIPLRPGALVVESHDGCVLVTWVEFDRDATGRILPGDLEPAVVGPQRLGTQDTPPGWDWAVGEWDAQAWIAGQGVAS